MGSPESALMAVTQVLSGYRPGFRLVDGIDKDAVEQFTILPARGLPRLLLPTKGAAMTTALKSFVGGHRWASFAPSVLQVVSKTAGGVPVLSRDISLVSDTGGVAPVRELISSVLGRSDFELAFRLSVGRPNAKSVAMAITEDGTPLCFAKFGSEDMTNALVKFEGEVLEHFQDRDLPVLMPRVLHADVWEVDHHVLITEPLQIEPLKRQAINAHRAADAFTMASPTTSSTLRESEYWRGTIERVEAVGEELEHKRVVSNAVEFIDAHFGDVEFDFGYSHGDWSRPNLGTLNGHLVALDWERCRPQAPRGIDITHFALIENSSTTAGRALDVERIESHTRHYLDAISRSPLHARPLVALDLLEMVLRFSSAQAAGIPSTDNHFGAALQTAMLQWKR